MTNGKLIQEFSDSKQLSTQLTCLDWSNPSFIIAGNSKGQLLIWDTIKGNMLENWREKKSGFFFECGFFLKAYFDFSLEFANRKIQFIRARSMMSWFRRICQFSQLVPTDISTNGIYKPHNNFSKSKLRKKKQHRRNGKLTIQQKKKKSNFKKDHSPSTKLCLSHNNSMLVSANTGIKLWDLSSKKVLKKFSGHTHSIIGLCFDKSDTLLISCATNDRFICMWDCSNEGSSEVESSAIKGLLFILKKKKNKWTTFLTSSFSIHYSFQLRY